MLAEHKAELDKLIQTAKITGKPNKVTQGTFAGQTIYPDGTRKDSEDKSDEK